MNDQTKLVRMLAALSKRTEHSDIMSLGSNFVPGVEIQRRFKYSRYKISIHDTFLSHIGCLTASEKQV